MAVVGFSGGLRGDLKGWERVWFAEARRRRLKGGAGDIAGPEGSWWHQELQKRLIVVDGGIVGELHGLRNGTAFLIAPAGLTSSFIPPKY